MNRCPLCMIKMIKILENTKHKLRPVIETDVLWIYVRNIYACTGFGVVKFCP